MKSGIYQIKNMINGKVYIGSAINFSKRKQEHFNYPKKSAILLQKALTKYGKGNFEFTQIEFCEKESLYKNEQYWMDHFQSYKREFGYNIAEKAEGSRGGTKEGAAKSVKTKRLKGFNKNTYPELSISKLGNKNPMFGRKGKDNPTSKKVYCYNKENVLLFEFECCKQASIKLNIPRRSISRVASGERPLTHNLRFYYTLIK